MGKKLARNVNLDGTTYLAGTEVPKDVADAITNPKAWEEDPSASDGDPAAQDRFVGDVASDSPPDPKETADKEPAEGETSISTSTAARRAAAKKSTASGS